MQLEVSKVTIDAGLKPRGCGALPIFFLRAPRRPRFKAETAIQPMQDGGGDGKRISARIDRILAAARSVGVGIALTMARENYASIMRKDRLRGAFAIRAIIPMMSAAAIR